VDLRRDSNTTLPLARTADTPSKPTASNHAQSSRFVARRFATFIPRRKAT
jgi:hypothetical protein